MRCNQPHSLWEHYDLCNSVAAALTDLTALTSLQIGHVKSYESEDDPAVHIIKVSPQYDEWMDQYGLRPSSPLSLGFSSSLQVLEIPDVTVTADAVLPSSLRVLTVKCFDPQSLPAACSTLQGLALLQELELAHVPPWRYTDGNLAGVLERTVQALLPCVRPLSKLTQLTVMPRARERSYCVLTSDALRAWVALKEGVPAVDLRLYWLGHCAGRQQWPCASITFRGYGDAPLTMEHLALLLQMPAGVADLSFEGRDVLSLITPSQFAGFIRRLMGSLCSVKLQGVRLRPDPLQAFGEEMLPVTTALGALPKLQDLSLSDCMLSNAVVLAMLAGLRGSGSLRRMYLSREGGKEARLTDVVMPAIAALKNLEFLDLRHHNITRQGVRELESCGLLQWLAVTGNAQMQAAVMEVCPYNFHRDAGCDSWYYDWY
jgi:hypothetical protein